MQSLNNLHHDKLEINNLPQSNFMNNQNIDIGFNIIQNKQNPINQNQLNNDAYENKDKFIKINDNILNNIYSSNKQDPIFNSLELRNLDALKTSKFDGPNTVEKKNFNIIEEKNNPTPENHSLTLPELPETYSNESAGNIEKLKITLKNRLNNRLFHFSLLSIFCFHFVLIIFSFFIQSKLKFSEGYYFIEIAKNWNSKFINNITLNSCTDQEHLLIQDKWPGTNYGCKCDNANIEIGHCGRESPCTTELPIDPIPIAFWRGVKFCKNIQNLNYLDLNIESTADN